MSAQIPAVLQGMLQFCSRDEPAFREYGNRLGIRNCLIFLKCLVIEGMRLAQLPN